MSPKNWTFLPKKSSTLQYLYGVMTVLVDLHHTADDIFVSKFALKIDVSKFGHKLEIFDDKGAFYTCRYSVHVL